MTDELPRGWAKCRVQDIFHSFGGGTPSKRNLAYWGGDIPWFSSGDIKTDRVNESSESITRLGLENSSANLCKAGSVLVVVRSGILKHTLPVALLGRAAAINQDIKCFDAGDDQLNKWLALSLRASTREILAQNREGTTVESVRYDTLRNLELSVAPLAEQLRIDAKLEKLLPKVKGCQERLARIPILLNRFRQSVLAAACSGRLTADWRKKQPDLEPVAICIEKLRRASSRIQVRRGVPEEVPVSDSVALWELPETWGCYSAAELLRIGAFVDLKDGNHGSNHPKVSDFSASGLPFITAAQVNNYQIDYDGAYKLAGKPLKRINVGFAKAGDVIYTHKGSVGRVGIADRDCILTPQTTYYRVSPTVFVNRFLMYYLASQPFSQQVNIIKEQTTRDFVPISEQYLLFHRVPPIAEQQEIVRRVDQWFALADQIEFRHQEAQHRVERLPQSILARAFQGELVPTEAELAEAEGRSFESAEALLDRLGRANRNETEAKQGNQSRRAKKAVV